MTGGILGLDVAQSTGWAYWRPGGVVACGALDLKGKDPDQLLAHHAEFRELLETWHPIHLAIEDVQFVGSRDAHASYWRIRTLAELAWAQFSSQTCLLVATGRLKSWATGNGNADKHAMCARASKLTGWSLQARPAGTKAQEDQADACLVSLWAAEHLGL